MPKKIFVLLPDGVSLRNFVYTSFYKQGVERGYELVFWNHTPFDLNALGLPHVTTSERKVHWKTDVLKAACIRVELALYEQRDRDEVYRSYVFPFSAKGLKGLIKKSLIAYYFKKYNSESGLLELREHIREQERKGDYYQRCKSLIAQEKPDFIFCTSQRSVTSIAPLTAAQDSHIPTATFIFSWDNVPKATTVVTADFYFVWSAHMKKEVLHYQRYVKPDQIKVTGTPQFEPHFDKQHVISKTSFFKNIGLDASKKYICFSGDDPTTSPRDELYLRDVAKAVRALNLEGENLAILFRRCPVDFSDRYDLYLKEYTDVIVSVPPLWERVGEGWNTVLPMQEDLDVLVNIAAHTEGVINLASSMVFDFVAFEKPCAYMNYNYLNPKQEVQKGVYLYDFVHFRSMPDKNAVVWLDHPDTIGKNIKKMLQGVPDTIAQAKRWFEVINESPPEVAAKRVWDHIGQILS